MRSKERQLGYFWYVWDMIRGYTKEFDHTDNEISFDGRFYRIDKKIEDAWELIRSENNFPKKSYDHYVHGEILYDMNRYKFVVIAPAKFIQNSANRDKIINYFGLSTYTLFFTELV